MVDECIWTTIIYLLYDNELYKLFEKYVKENAIIKENDVVANMPTEQLAKSVRLFLNTLDETAISDKAKKELLRYC